jgi:ABC-type uncharacterized transport system permease subunit
MDRDSFTVFMLFFFSVTATPLHSFQSLATLCQFLIPIAFRSSSTLSLHLYRGLPLFLIPSILAVTVLAAVLPLLVERESAVWREGI